MYRAARLHCGAALAALLLVCAAGATTIGRLSLDEMTVRSETIVSGEITDSWAAWDAGHKYIWTHYLVAVDSTVKGRAGRTVEIAEPGGIIDNIGMNIGGATGYNRGERALIFLQRMPNGYLRTAGLGQGKYGIDAQGRLHGIALKSVDVMETGSAAVEAVRSLEGMTVPEAGAHIATRMRVAAAKGVR